MNIHQVTQVLIAEELDFAKLQQAVVAYRNFLTQEDHLIGLTEEFRMDIELDSGKAIGTAWAALCIDDLVRTKRFVKGLCEAVRAVLATKEGPVVILYAGTGPFAALALPLTTMFRVDQIRIRALEINPLSCQYLERLLDSLAVAGYFESIKQVDASHYQIPAPKDIDILLSETMQRGLEKEPQVAIMQNLVPQLREDVILIPERIELSIGTILYPNGTLTQMVHQSFFPVFVLDQDGIREHHQADGGTVFPSRQYKLSKIQLAHSRNLVLLTHISVFGREKLTPGESGITLPVKLPSLQQDGEEEVLIELTYEGGQNPGMRFRELL